MSGGTGDKPNRSWSRCISRRFINGLILLVPLAITFFVVAETLHFTEGVLGKHLPFYFPGMGLITLLVIIYVTGWASSYWAGRRLIHIGETLLGKIPVVKFIYNSVKHLSTAVFESNNMFDQVVLVPFHQSQALGFIMADVPEMLKEKLGDEYVCVFIPWSLNMTSGTNLFVRKTDVIYLDISSESALQYMLTAGAVMPKRQSAPLVAEPGDLSKAAASALLQKEKK
ncbi:Uncharacterized membrane protein [Selenomonas ruminantium]|uniref:Uncharacterized membrane protein n=1 Tax=Selenomonas ruminantium TaxID=971 RepID=A0A1I3CBX6_SELRU|nr:DUF502 domain-containing protein [Selenomonas ruminantium]SFH72050.1 Uncharacterized membrane protein [Selenomonas ruminantium]